MLEMKAIVIKYLRNDVLRLVVTFSLLRRIALSSYLLVFKSIDERNDWLRKYRNVKKNDISMKQLLLLYN